MEILKFRGKRASSVDPQYPHLVFRSNGAISKQSTGLLKKQNSRWCPDCKTVLPCGTFNKNVRICKKCAAIRDIEKLKTPHGRFVVAKAAGRNSGQGRVWTLTEEQYTALIVQPCEYCQFELTNTKIGLDRLDNMNGYEFGNVVPCCKECNIARMDNFTPNEMRLYIGPAIRAAKLARVK